MCAAVHRDHFIFLRNKNIKAKHSCCPVTVYQQQGFTPSIYFGIHFNATHRIVFTGCRIISVRNFFFFSETNCCQKNKRDSEGNKFICSHIRIWIYPFVLQDYNRISFTFSETRILPKVRDLMSSTLTPGAVSINKNPSSVISNTASSVTTLRTQ